MTQSLEDYLEMIGFIVSEGADSVRVTDIAARLGVSKPSVLSALKALEERGYVRHERYRGVTLTDAGTERSVEIQARHQFLTTFLEQIVGVSPETAAKDACRMEHVLSPETLERMRAIVGCSDS